VAAHDVCAPARHPSTDCALIDGYALASAELIGASPMSPAILMEAPRLVQVGDPLPVGADCVVDAGFISVGPMTEATAPAAPGDGVRRAGGDFRHGEVIVRSGERLDALRAHALLAAGVLTVCVRRPVVRVLAVGGAGVTAGLVAALARDAGADARLAAAPRDRDSLAGSLAGVDGDAVILVGGTGCGVDDRTIIALRCAGANVIHGLALEPGRTGAAGLIDGRPVIAAPGRPEAALAVWLALGAPLMSALLGVPVYPLAAERPLTRKLASTVGLAQIAALEATAEGWRPLAVGDMSLAHLARADGFLLVPEDSEGRPEGALVRPVPAPGRWRV
jgi:molybdopterin biosynthesis enzyme